MRFKMLVASGAALAWMLPAQPALAATVGVFEGLSEFGSRVLQVRYEAAIGEINDVSVVEAPEGVYVFTDLSAAMTPLAGCTSISPTSVRCQVDPGLPDEAEVRTKDGADSVDVTSESALVLGGHGSDTLTTRSWGFLVGGSGDDRLVALGTDDVPSSLETHLQGGKGADSLVGGPGNEHLDGGPGTDDIAGGPERDMVSYYSRNSLAPVRISLDGRANYGAAGENDWIRAGVERAEGSRGPTTFIGNSGPNSFYGFWSARRGAGDVVRTKAGDDFVLLGRGPNVVSGGGGDDIVLGGRGRDLLSGGPGDDRLNGDHAADLILGGPGNDILNGAVGEDDLRGGRGNDWLSGGRRNDVLRGGPGHDRVGGGWGDDVLYARDRNRDIVRGGAGRDRARVDPIDALWSVEALF